MYGRGFIGVIKFLYRILFAIFTSSIGSFDYTASTSLFMVYFIFRRKELCIDSYLHSCVCLVDRFDELGCRVSAGSEFSHSGLLLATAILLLKIVEYNF